MDKSEIAGFVKSDLITDLTTNFLSTQDLPSILLATKCIEGYLRDQLQWVLLKNVPLVIVNSKYDQKCKEISIDGRNYKALAKETIYGSLEVGLIPCDIRIPSRQYFRKEIRLSKYGEYDQAIVFVPNEFQGYSDWICELTTLVFQTGYLWLEECIRSVLSRQDISAGLSIYSYLRPIVANDELLRNIWFGCSVKNRGIYLLEPSTATAALDSISMRPPELGKSSLQTLAEFLGCNIPADQTFGTIAVAENKSLDVILPASKYSEDLPVLVRAQLKVFGSEDITIFPISKNRSGYLSASFPTDKKAILLPILTLHRDRLAELYNNAHKQLSQLVKLIHRPGGDGDYSAIGGFLGAFGAAWIKEASKP